MSVINAMLKKLDARGAPLAQADGIPGLLPATEPVERARKSSRLTWLLLGGGLVIGFTALADWPRLVGSAPASVDVAAVPEPSAPMAVAVAEPAAPSVAPPVVPAVAPVAEPKPAAPSRAIPEPARVVAALAPAKAAVPDPAPASPPAAELPAMRTPASLAPPVALPARIEKRASAQTPEQRTQALYRQAAELAQAGQRRTALERTREALSIDPRHAPTRLLAAVLEHETGANDRAIGLLRDGLALHPRDAAQALLLARILVAQGATAEALAVLDQQAVTGAEADGLRGGILAQQGDFKRSLLAYESAARQQPGNPMWWFGLGVALDSEGHAPRARQAYARAQSIGLPRDDLTTYADQRLRSID